MPDSPPVALEGTVERIFFESPDGAFTAARLRLEDGSTATVRGPLAGLEPGATVRVEGAWREHPKYGPQLEAVRWEPILPKTTEGVERFLAESGIPGVGERTARRIVEALGAGALDRIDADPRCLKGVKGLRPKVREAIVVRWREKRAGRETLSFLYGLGLGPGLASRIYKAFGPMAQSVVRESPYRLCREVSGIGFLTADRLARALGIPEDSPARVEEALAHVLAEAAASEGHCYLPAELLTGRAARLLKLEPEHVAEGIGRLARARRCVADRDGDRPVALPELAGAEASLAEDLLARAGGDALSGPSARDLAPFRLTAEQAEAVRRSAGSALSVITGGPGVGKTTVIRALSRWAAKAGLKVALAAPTGRAAKRMEEVTGMKATTLHVLLRFDPAAGGFASGREKPLEHDLVIVDEASMLDVPLAARLAEAVPPEARLVFVGDEHQLPSVGPGSFLRDLIACGRFPVHRLTRIFRQAADSRIVLNAHRVNRGEPPDLAAHGGDFVFVERRDASEAREAVLRLVAERIPAKRRMDPFRDIHVMSPMQKGEAGVAALNAALQERLNPGKGGIRQGVQRLREGDKVMQVVNDYAKGVMNGDVGRVLVADETSSRLVVLFGDREVAYEGPELEEVMLAYATTIHKAQGSESPAAVVALLDSHHVMLARNLLYTAITRGKELVVIVGSRRAVLAAVRNDRIQRRYSTLRKKLLADGNAGPEQALPGDDSA